jgi:Secretion system C-terminal sorting domain
MTKTIYNFTLLICILFISNTVSAQGFVWSRQVELIDMDMIASIGHTSTDVEKDANGNLYMSGSYSGTQKFGDSTITSTGFGNIPTDDGFIAKYSANGTFQWLKTFPSTLIAQILDIEIDANGNIYLLAVFKDNITIDTALIQSSNDDGIVIAKLNNSGELQWKTPIIQANTFNTITGYHIALNDSAVFLSGAFTTAVTISGNILNSPYPGEPAIFIVGFDYQTGGFKWSNITGIGTLSGLGNMTTDKLGNVYMASTVTGNYQIGGVPINALSKAVILILKIDSKGIITWVRQSEAGGFFSNSVNDIDLNPVDGSIILTGDWADTLIFGGMQLITPANAIGKKLMWLAKFNDSGNIIWIKSNNTPTINPASTNGLFVDFTTNGDIFLSGEYAGGDMSLGTGNNKVLFSFDGSGYLAKYLSNGTLSWAKELKCTTVDCWLNIKGMTGVANNRVVITGLFKDHFVLDTVSLDAVYPGTVSRPNIYLVKADGDIIVTSTPKPLYKNRTSLLLYPNPAKDYLHITIDGPGFQSGRFEIIDLEGRLLVYEDFEGLDHSIAISHLPNGIYFFKISGTAFNSIQKFIIQK